METPQTQSSFNSSEVQLGAAPTQSSQIELTFKGTPGPWVIGYSTNTVTKEDSFDVWGQYDWETLEAQGAPVCLVSPVRLLDARDKANGQLIAQAPELLDFAMTVRRLVADLSIPKMFGLNEELTTFLRLLDEAAAEQIEKAVGEKEETDA